MLHIFFYIWHCLITGRHILHFIITVNVSNHRKIDLSYWGIHMNITPHLALGCWRILCVFIYKTYIIISICVFKRCDLIWRSRVNRNCYDICTGICILWESLNGCLWITTLCTEINHNLWFWGRSSCNRCTTKCHIIVLWIITIQWGIESFFIIWI